MAMSSENQVKVMDVRDHKSQYIALLEAKDERKADELKELYNEWGKLFYSYGSALVMNTNALSNHVSSLKQHKINPYLAGGAANGALGLGAGVAAGVSAYARNTRIDEDRKRWGEEVQNTSMSLAENERLLLSKTESILSLVNQYSEAKSVVENYYAVKKSEIETANYSHKSSGFDGTRQLIIALCSAGAALFCSMFVLAAGAQAFVTVFIIAFIISEIYFQIKT